MSCQRIFFVVLFYYVSMGVNDPRDVANLNPGAWLGGHYALLHTKYRSWPFSFREDFLKVFPHLGFSPHYKSV